MIGSTLLQFILKRLFEEIVMITIWNSKYSERELIKLKLCLYEASGFLCDNFGNNVCNIKYCKECKSKMLCKDFTRAIAHVEKLVETVENQNH